MPEGTSKRGVCESRIERNRSLPGLPVGVHFQARCLDCELQRHRTIARQPILQHLIEFHDTRDQFFLFACRGENLFEFRARFRAELLGGRRWIRFSRRSS